MTKRTTAKDSHQAPSLPSPIELAHLAVSMSATSTAACSDGEQMKRAMRLWFLAADVLDGVAKLGRRGADAAKTAKDSYTAAAAELFTSEREHPDNQPMTLDEGLEWISAQPVKSESDKLNGGQAGIRKRDKLKSRAGLLCAVEKDLTPSGSKLVKLDPEALRLTASGLRGLFERRAKRRDAKA